MSDAAARVFRSAIRPDPPAVPALPADEESAVDPAAVAGAGTGTVMGCPQATCVPEPGRTLMERAVQRARA
ncbi:hypothetical protein [Streptomyces sp. NPDC001153]